MLNNSEIVIAIVALVAGMALTMAVFFPLLKKKGVNTEQMLDTAQSTLKTADTITDGLEAALPGLPGIGLINQIIGWAQKGVTAAEQLNKASTITAAQRKETAVNLVKQCLTVANVEVTPDVEKIIDGAVEAAVFALPKTAAAV